MSKDLENKPVCAHTYTSRPGITLKEFYFAVAVHGILSGKDWSGDLDTIVENASHITNNMIKTLNERS